MGIIAKLIRRSHAVSKRVLFCSNDQIPQPKVGTAQIIQNQVDWARLSDIVGKQIARKVGSVVSVTTYETIITLFSLENVVAVISADDIDTSATRDKVVSSLRINDVVTSGTENRVFARAAKNGVYTCLLYTSDAADE